VLNRAVRWHGLSPPLYQTRGRAFFYAQRNALIPWLAVWATNAILLASFIISEAAHLKGRFRSVQGSQESRRRESNIGFAG